MAKFNTTNTIRTTNKDGHVAYKMRDKELLVTQVLTSFFNEKQFYGSNTKDMIAALKRVIKNDPEFVSNLAVFARREFNMRSVSHVLTAYLAHEESGKPYVRKTVKGIALRGDDVTELMAFYLNTFGKPIPNSLKKGINDVLVGFDEYTMAKYKGDSKDVKMRDLLCLCRPKPTSREQEALWKRCLEGTLEIPETWETQISKYGNNARAWEKLIKDNKLNYMAALRNLRNIIQADPIGLDKVLKKIADPEAVKRSRQLPFRYLSAYKSVSKIGSSKVFDALEDAMDASIKNLPRLPGKTVITVDVSGSMTCSVSKNSDVTCADISTLLGLIANRICDDAIVLAFDDKLYNLDASSRAGILHTAVHAHPHGGGTNMALPFEHLINKRIKCDRVIVLSDNMVNSGYTWYTRKTVGQLANDYRASITKPDVWVHAVDLQGYGTQQFNGKYTNIIAGWSEKLFEFILLAERGVGSLEKRIAGYRW